MEYILIFILLSLGFIMVYMLLPHIICRFDVGLREIKQQLASRQTKRQTLSYHNYLLHSLKRYLKQAGWHKQHDRRKLFLFYVFIPLFILLCGHQYALLLVVGWLCMINSLISSRIKKKRQKYSCLLYKIYRFINMELEAGLVLGDILSSLDEAADDEELRTSLRKMSAAWQLTGDLNLAIGELEDVFGRHETDLLANNLRQCLVTGVAGKAFSQMENLLFSRYVEHIRRRSQQLKTRLIICVGLALTPVIIIMLWPLLAEMFAALANIFA